MITIDQNDLSNGVIGFAEDSKSVLANEDTDGIVVLKLARTDAFFGEVEVLDISVLKENFALFTIQCSVNV